MKKKNWKAELGRFDIHMKGGGIEKFLNEVAVWWERFYPAKADWFKTQLRNMREVTTEGARYDAGKGREFRVVYRIPTELMLFIQRWVPEFGRDSRDVETLCRVWCDLVRPAKDNRRRTRFYIERTPPHVEKPREEDEEIEAATDTSVRQDDADRAVPAETCDSCLGDHDREELGGEPREDAPVAPGAVPPRGGRTPDR